jgi:hypothetical protein
MIEISIAPTYRSMSSNLRSGLACAVFQAVLREVAILEEFSRGIFQLSAGVSIVRFSRALSSRRTLRLKLSDDCFMTFSS